MYKPNPQMKAQREYIPDDMINRVIALWQLKQPERIQTVASPSTLLECPRVVWCKKQNVPFLNKLGWGKKQRFLLGRQLENMIAGQLKDEGRLLYHWADNYEGESDKFSHGKGVDKIEGTPDLLLIGDNSEVLISDSKTSRSDSYGYVPIQAMQAWEDPYYYRYKLQVTAYYMLCYWNKQWFLDNNIELPTHCNLFSYALDDGIVRRNFTWLPSTKDFNEVKRLTRRWNQAYSSLEMPDCTCIEYGIVLFCPYGKMAEGKKIVTECCNDNLVEFTRSTKNNNYSG